MPSDVPAVMTTRSGSSGMPRRCALGGDRLARRRDADRRRVPVVPVTDRALDRLDQMRRGPEPEGDRVADIQVPDLAPGRLHLPRFRDDIADRVDEAADTAGDGICSPIVREGIAGILMGAGQPWQMSHSV